MSGLPRPRSWAVTLESTGAWFLALLWMLPLIYAFWSAFHPPEFSTRFELFAPLTLENFEVAWSRAPFARYFLNTFILVTMILIAQFILCTLAAFAFARFDFPGKSIAFVFVLLQLMIMPEVLIVENYVTMSKLGAVDTIAGIGLPYMASRFRYFPPSPDIQDDSQRTRGSSEGRGVFYARHSLEGLCTPGQTDLRRLRLGLRQPPLE